MKKEIHLLIMVALLIIFLIFKNANKIQKSVSEWVLNKYGELRIVKFIAFMIPILMCIYFYMNLNYSKQSSINNSIFTFFMYLFLGLLIFFINEFYQLKEDLLLPSGIKVNTLKLFRHLKNENIVNGKFTDFCNFLSQSNQPKKQGLLGMIMTVIDLFIKKYCHLVFYVF